MLILLPSFNVPYGFPGECLSISSHNTFRNTKPRRNLMTSSLHHVLYKPYTGESCPLIEQYFLVLNRKIYIILKSTRMLLCRILSQYVKQYHNRRVGSTNILDDYFDMIYGGVTLHPPTIHLLGGSELHPFHNDTSSSVAMVNFSVSPCTATLLIMEE